MDTAAGTEAARERPGSRRVEIGHAQVLAIALPITLSNATVPLIGFVDTAVVGSSVRRT